VKYLGLRQFLKALTGANNIETMKSVGQRCGSKIFIRALDFLSISDPKTGTKKGGKVVVLPVFVSTNITKLKIIFFNR